MSKSERFKRLAQTRESETSNPQKPGVIEKIVGNFEDEKPESLLNTIHEEADASIVSNTNTEYSSTTINNNSDTEQLNVTKQRNSNTEQSKVTKGRKKGAVTKIPRPIEEFEKRLKKPTIEETHTRATWLVRNDLLKRLEKLAKHQSRGFKTHLVNYALERILDEIENN